MIARTSNDRLLLITQPDHAALAGRIVAAWTNDGLPASARRADILRAAFEHDNGWLEEDLCPRLSSEGRVLDFMTAPNSVRQGIWPRGTSRLGDTPYAAALVAQHAISIFERYRSDAAWQEYFAAMEERRDECLAESGETMDTLTRDYFFVNVGDLASLIFCNGWTDEEKVRSYRLKLEGSCLRISPDPFGGREIPLGVSARILRDRPFDSERDAALAFDAAPRTQVVGVASGPA